ncbi:MAG: hypothetical protein AAF483_04315 [Planctomycetota bacterium]
MLGNLQLEETFASPEFESFNQRLAARCYLSPMSEGDTKAFVEHQLRCVNIEPNQFISSDALLSVYAGSEGVPRIANQIVDQAIILAMTQYTFPITGQIIEEAWADLQQLPAPWAVPNPRNAALRIEAIATTPAPSVPVHAAPPHSEHETTDSAASVASKTTLNETEKRIQDDYAAEILSSSTSTSPIFGSSAPPQAGEHLSSGAEESSYSNTDELGDLQALADEIANAQRVSYDVEFGELSTDANKGVEVTEKAASAASDESTAETPMEGSATCDSGCSSECGAHAPQSESTHEIKTKAEDLEQLTPKTIDTQQHVAEGQQENYEELIGIDLGTPEQSVSGYELSCSLDIAQAPFEYPHDDDIQDATSSETAEEAHVIDASHQGNEGAQTEDEELTEDGPNFFAAFNPPEEGELPASIQAALDTTEDEQPSADIPQTESENPQNVDDIDAEDATHPIQTVAEATETRILPTDSFFAARPTDEQLIAFEEEQSEFQAMGMWDENGTQNDAVASIEIFSESTEGHLGSTAEQNEPHPTFDSSEEDSQSIAEHNHSEPSAESHSVSEAVTPSSNQLFGSDFEEEISLEQLADETTAPHTDETRSALNEVTESAEESAVPTETISVSKSEGQTREPTTANDATTKTNLSNTDEFQGQPDFAVQQVQWDESSFTHPTEQVFAVEAQDTSRDAELAPESEETESAYKAASIQEAGEGEFGQAPAIAVNSQSPSQNEQEQTDAPSSSGTEHEVTNSECENWSVDVVAIDVEREENLQTEINDLVSQLNFSGIQLGFSEEQLPTEPSRNEHIENIPSHPESNALDPVQENPSHSPLSNEMFSDRDANYDDDRDMLIIEEEVTQPDSATQETATTVNLAKHRSYSQLFAKLRK